MFRIIHSYFLRTKRMPVRIVSLVLPIIFSLLFTLYLRTSNTLSGIETFAFFGVFSILALFSASFFVGMVYESDKNTSHYANDLRIGIGRKKLFIGRFLFILLLFFLIELIASLIFYAYLLISNTNFEARNFFLMFVINLLGILPNIVIYQFMTLKYNYTGSIILGGFLTLGSILLGTTDLGALIWKFLPFTYPIKLIHSLANGQIATGQIYKFLTISVFVCIILLWIISLWFEKWDGYSKVEE